MSDESELEFLVRRESEEVEFAKGSHDPAVANAHRELAIMYARKVAEYDARPIDAIGPLSRTTTSMPQSSTSMR